MNKILGVKYNRISGLQRLFNQLIMLYGLGLGACSVPIYKTAVPIQKTRVSLCLKIIEL